MFYGASTPPPGHPAYLASVDSKAAELSCAHIHFHVPFHPSPRWSEVCEGSCLSSVLRTVTCSFPSLDYPPPFPLSLQPSLNFLMAMGPSPSPQHSGAISLSRVPSCSPHWSEPHPSSCRHHTWSPCWELFIQPKPLP